MAGLMLKKEKNRVKVLIKRSVEALLTVCFGAPSMFITLWFGFDVTPDFP
jgi:hypothetical protein